MPINLELIERDIADMKRDLNKLEKNVGEFKKQYSEDITPNINTWNATSANISKIVWVVIIGVVGALFALIGLK